MFTHAVIIVFFYVYYSSLSCSDQTILATFRRFHITVELKASAHVQ